MPGARFPSRNGSATSCACARWPVPSRRRITRVGRRWASRSLHGRARMAERQTLLVELGTEELPPKALRELEHAFSDGIAQGLRDAALFPGRTRSYATPRRLAVFI